MPFQFLYSWFGIGIAIVQGLFLIHAIMTGRNNWIWLLLVLPGVSCIAYFWMEMLPDPTFLPSVRESIRDLKNALPFGKSSLAQLEAEVEYSPTVANKELLADEYVVRRQFDKAILLYEQCLTGAYQDDEGLLHKLTEAQYLGSEFASALKTMQKLRSVKNNHLHPSEQLLYAKTLLMLNKKEALEEMRNASHEYYGLEPDYLYLQMLLEKGEQAKAQKQFEESKRKFNEMLNRYKGEQRGWMNKISSLKR
jgi:hypothetical protein